MKPQTCPPLQQVRAVSRPLLITLSALFLGQTTPADAQTSFDFSSGQGFAAGSLEGQPADSPVRWRGASSLRVDPSQGAVTWDVTKPFSSWNCVSLSAPTPETVLDEKDISISVDFELIDLVQTKDSAAQIFAINLLFSADPYDRNSTRILLSVLIKEDKLILGLMCFPSDANILQPLYITVPNVAASSVEQSFRLQLSIFGGDGDSATVKGALLDKLSERELASTAAAPVPLSYVKPPGYPGLSFGNTAEFSHGKVVIRSFDASW